MSAWQVCQALLACVKCAGVYHLFRVAELDEIRRKPASSKDFLDGQAVRKLGRVAAYPRGPNARQNRQGRPI